jgi:hypothetical protein
MSTNAHETEVSLRSGPVLVLWMALVIVAQAVLWASGAKQHAVEVAVERGAARAESWGIGEVGDDVIRKAIQTQQATRTFWATLMVLGDFIAEPLSVAVRALLVATVFSGLAALTGRPSAFAAGLAGCIAAQGCWVLGLLVRAALVAALRRPDVETSLTLLLPPGSYDATVWVALRQLDLFVLVGWTALAVGGWRRGQVSGLAAASACAALAWLEAVLRMSAELILGAGMRLTLIPEELV